MVDDAVSHVAGGKSPEDVHESLSTVLELWSVHAHAPGRFPAVFAVTSHMDAVVPSTLGCTHSLRS